MAAGRYCDPRVFHDFRVWAGIMGKKESHYVTTQRAGDPGRSSGSTAGRQRRSCSAGSRRIARYAEESAGRTRSEEHTSELQSLMRISYAVFCLKQKITNRRIKTTKQTKIHR